MMPAMLQAPDITLFAQSSRMPLASQASQNNQTFATASAPPSAPTQLQLAAEDFTSAAASSGLRPTSSSGFASAAVAHVVGPSMAKAVELVQQSGRHRFRHEGSQLPRVTTENSTNSHLVKVARISAEAATPLGIGLLGSLAKAVASGLGRLHEKLPIIVNAFVGGPPPVHWTAHTAHTWMTEDTLCEYIDGKGCESEMAAVLGVFILLLFFVVLVSYLLCAVVQDVESNITPLSPQLIVKPADLRVTFTWEATTNVAEVKDLDGKLICRAATEFTEQKAHADIVRLLGELPGLSNAELEQISAHAEAQKGLKAVKLKNANQFVLAQLMPTGGPDLVLCRAGNSEVFGFVSPDGDGRYAVKHRTGTLLLMMLGDFAAGKVEVVNPRNIRVAKFDMIDGVFCLHLEHEVDLGLIITSFLAAQVLQVSPEASDADIAKQYKRLSVLIHPDKCKHEKAAEAFQVLAKAYGDTKDPAYQDKYKDVVGDAKIRVRQRREEENKEREKRGEDPLDMQGHEFDQEVLRECEKMTTEVAEATEHKNAVLEANLKRQKEMAKELKAKRREEDQEKRKWERQRDKRVAGWQVFMNNVESKKMKTVADFGVGSSDKHHKREVREMTAEEMKDKQETETDKERRKRLQNEGREYKTLWR